MEKRQIIILENGKKTKLYIGEDQVTYEPCTQEEAEKFTIYQQRMVIRMARDLNKPVPYHELYKAYSGEVDRDASQRVHRMKMNLPATIQKAIKTKHAKGYALVGTLVNDTIQGQADSIPHQESWEPVSDEGHHIPNSNSMHEINNKAENSFNPNKYTRSQWRYRIVLLDDITEYLELLKDAINALYINETRYEVDLHLCSTFFDVSYRSNITDVDVFVLDVARKSMNKIQTREFDYFGYDFFKTLIYERPNVLLRSKIIFYSKLPMDIIRREYGELTLASQGRYNEVTGNRIALPEIEYLTKKDNSPTDVARYVKEYLDAIYQKESTATGSE